MAIAKDEADGVAADAVKPGDGDAGEFGAGIGTVDAAEYVGLAHIIGAGGEGAEFIHRIEVLATVGPADGDLIPDEVDSFRRRNGSHEEDCASRACWWQARRASLMVEAAESGEREPVLRIR